MEKWRQKKAYHNRQASRYRRIISDSKNKLTTTAEFNLDQQSISKDESTGTSTVGPEEKMMSPGLSSSEEEKITIKVKNPDGKRKASKSTYNYDIKLSVIKREICQERIFSDDEITTAPYQPEVDGPPGYKITWNALAKIIILCVSYAIPANRLALMLGNRFGAFCSSQISRLLRFAAELFEDIYLCLPDQLAELSILFGDDSPTNVTDSYLEEETDDKKKKKKYFVRIRERLGQKHLRKDGKGFKSKLHVSFVAGRTDPTDPRSWIFFFHTHVGSLGDLLSRIFYARSRKNKKIKIQGDLSSANHLDSLISSLFETFYAGCGFHARRPFWRHREDDPGFCYLMLSSFALLARLEKRLRKDGASPQRVVELRTRHGTKIWSIILEACLQVIGEKPCTSPHQYRWPSDHPIHKAAKYVVKNFPALTAYLRDPEIFFTNNLCERLLRREKMMLVSSKFRRNKDGRTAFDILQTITATSTAAGVDLADYLYFVWKNRKAIKIDPTSFTPYGYAMSLEKTQECQAS